MINDKSYDEWSRLVNQKLASIPDPSWGTYREIAKEFGLSFSEVWDMSGMADALEEDWSDD